MIEAKHTPGPWRAAPQPGQTVGVHTYTHCVMHGDDSLADTLTEPDARLMAAAPDLLVACREGLERLYRMTCPKNVAERDEVIRVREVMRLAIERATGGVA